VKKLEMPALLVFSASPEGGDYRISFCEETSVGAGKACGNGPLWLDIGGITILLYRGASEGISPLELLKRRHLGSPPEDFIEIVPDIFLTNGPAGTENYKGTTIVSIGDAGTAKIDLHTREVKLEA